MLSNLSETLHSKRKLKNKEVAKIWCLYLNKQKIGAAMHFPEGLEDSPFKLRVLKYHRNCRFHATLMLKVSKILNWLKFNLSSLPK